ncbi:MAG: polysaccharide lyase 8 family protein [Pirellulales bacterium]|nr:polysaccharide lyase 8 family protein [Pirellulales bacterium]
MSRSEITRPRIVFGTAAGLALAGLALVLGPASAAAADDTPDRRQHDSAEKGGSSTVSDLETIKARILASLLEPVTAATAEGLIETLRPDGSWPNVDYQSARRSAWPPYRHLANVGVLTRAYKSPDSSLRDDPRLRGAVLAALDYWLKHDFRNSNWWWNEIGVPKGLAPTLLLLKDELTPAQRNRGLEILRRAKIGMTGQNLVWVTEITALRGILEEDADLVDLAYRRIAKEIRVSTGEGIQADFSFHQHGPCLYNHGYGAAFAADCSQIAAEVAGTQLAFPAEKIATLSSLILDGSQWMARGSASDFGAEGREITRSGQTAKYLATAAENMLAVPTGRESEFRALVGRASGRPAPPLQGNRHFWRSDMMTHHRAGYYASARMFSRRIANTDQPCNSEGLKSHHLADGCSMVMRTGREYADVFPVWDWQKIPGTTIEQSGQLNGSPRRQGQRSFVGGVSDGTYGMAAFDFARDALSARKSWFFFDDEYVCLGAAVACDSRNPVVTTLNQCRLEGDVVVASGGQQQTLGQGSHDLEDPGWVWHDRIAYVLLQPSRVGLSNDRRRGSWWAINHRYSEDEVARDVFSLWIDHGRRPQDAGYAYLVLPGVDPSAAVVCAERPPVVILRNDATVQAVRHEKLALAAMAFYVAGRVTVRPDLEVGVDTPCLVLLHESGDGLAISLANPENKGASVCVEINRKLRGEQAQLLAGEDRTRITLELPDGLNAGSSVTRLLRWL